MLVTADPSAKAITTTAPFGIATVASVGGGIATSTSGSIKGVRKATSAVDISGLTLPGAIQLSGLHWSAEYGSDGQPAGTFSIASASIGGTPIPTNNPAETLDQINKALTLFGLHLTAPTTRVDSNNKMVFVDPLALSVVPNSTRDSVAAATIKGIQQVREPLFDALLKAKCTLNTEITVFDIAVGSVTGAGNFNMLLGGVQAGSSEITANPFQLGFGGGSGGLGGGVETSSPTLGGGTVLGGGSSGATTPTGSNASGTPAGGTGSAAAAPAAALRSNGARGGALAGVGLGGLALMAAMAEGDRRKMRRAQREIPFTD